MDTPYKDLTPDLILDAVASVDLIPDGRQLALNSYENRVYQVGIEDSSPLIVKFYRPHRWLDEQILEEHRFSQSLMDADIPVVAPVLNDRAETLHTFKGYRFALYPRRGGRAPELDNSENLEWMGRLIGRIHAIAAVETFKTRPSLTTASFGSESIEFIMQSSLLRESQKEVYGQVAKELLVHIESSFEVPFTAIRLHGDCHMGNILWTDSGPHFVDLDDARMGPAIQDLWMMLSGNREQRTGQLLDIMEGYEQFAEFDVKQVILIEALRGLRMLHYAAWLARRWKDPAFPLNFPWFASEKYWDEHILSLREQSVAVCEPALRVT